MYRDVFSGIPEYVRITICSQVKKLSNTIYFTSDNDKDDIIQDLLLFYIEQFYKKPIPSEAYVVTSLRNEAKKLIRTKVRKRFGLFLSLEDIDFGNGLATDGQEFNRCEWNMMLCQMTASLSEKEKSIISLILAEKSLDEIARTVHVSKATIYKLFEKIRIFCKK